MSDFLIELEYYIPALRRYANALLRHGDEADDLVQDCLERAILKRSLWRKGSSLRPWLFTILHNLYVNQIRSMARKPEMHSDTSNLMHNMEPHKTHTLMNDIGQCIKQLPDQQREVLLLVTLEGFSYKEVAKIMRIPVGTVMSRLSRSRETVRKLMDGDTGPVLRQVK